MKKVISILMVLAMTLVLFAGCGNEPAGPGKENEQLHVAMIFTQSLGDAGPMDSMNTNLKKAEEDFNIKVSPLRHCSPLNMRKRCVPLQETVLTSSRPPCPAW